MSLKVLSKLDLSHNALISVEGLEEVEKLKDVNFSHNQLSSFPKFAATLTRIDLSHNQITSLEQISTPLPNLVFLDLNHNQISNVSANTLESFPKLSGKCYNIELKISTPFFFLHF